jgi:hypothetical protein
MRSISGRHDEIVAAGVREMVVFHSSADAMREFQADLPFTTIADPDKELYREFGVEASPKALLNLRAWSAATRGMKGQSLRGAAGLGEKHLGCRRTSSPVPTVGCSQPRTAATPTISGRWTNCWTSPAPPPAKRRAPVHLLDASDRDLARLALLTRRRDGGLGRALVRRKRSTRAS